jgi:hypothetical protein
LRGLLLKRCFDHVAEAGHPPGSRADFATFQIISMKVLVSLNCRAESLWDDDAGEIADTMTQLDQTVRCPASQKRSLYYKYLRYLNALFQARRAVNVRPAVPSGACYQYFSSLQRFAKHGKKKV